MGGGVITLPGVLFHGRLPKYYQSIKESIIYIIIHLIMYLSIYKSVSIIYLIIYLMKKFMYFPFLSLTISITIFSNLNISQIFRKKIHVVIEHGFKFYTIIFPRQSLQIFTFRVKLSDSIFFLLGLSPIVKLISHEK